MKLTQDFDVMVAWCEKIDYRGMFFGVAETKKKDFLNQLKPNYELGKFLMKFVLLKHLKFLKKIYVQSKKVELLLVKDWKRSKGINILSNV